MTSDGVQSGLGERPDVRIRIQPRGEPRRRREPARRDEEAKLVAGGMTLIPTLKLRLAKPTQLIDLGGDPVAEGHHARRATRS